MTAANPGQSACLHYRMTNPRKHSHAYRTPHRSLLWGMALDGFRPDRWDITGAVICILGVAVIMAHRAEPEAARDPVLRVAWNGRTWGITWPPLGIPDWQRRGRTPSPLALTGT